MLVLRIVATVADGVSAGNGKAGQYHLTTAFQTSTSAWCFISQHALVSSYSPIIVICHVFHTSGQRKLP
jgi:hypothetical protein